MQKTFDRILIISPATDGRGGIASVVNALYEASWPGEYRFCHLASQSDRGTICNIITLLSALLTAPWKILMCDLVHIHTASYNSFRRKILFMTICLLLRRKYLLHIHGGGFREFIENSNRHLKKIYSRYICHSAGIVTLAEPFYDVITGITDGKIPQWIIPNPGLFPITEKNFANGGFCNILFAGWLTLEKGVFDLLQAFQQAALPPEVKLTIVGKGDVEKLQKYAAELGISQSTEVCGWQSREEMISRYKEADLFVLPSYIEGMPMVLLEAMSFGLPVISTRVGGIPYMLPENAGEWLFTPGDIPVLSGLLQKINGMPAEERLAYGRNLQMFYAQKYSMETVIDKLDMCYKNLLYHT